MLEIEDDRGTIHAEALVRERWGHVHNQLDFLSKGAWTLLASLRASSNTIRSLCTNSTRDIRMDTIDLKDVNKRSSCPSWKL